MRKADYTLLAAFIRACAFPDAYDKLAPTMLATTSALCKRNLLE